MKGKITLETDGGEMISCSVDMRCISRKDKILLIDALCTSLMLDTMDILVLAELLVDGKIGTKEAPGKMVIGADMGMIDKILKEKKQESEGD